MGHFTDGNVEGRSWLSCLGLLVFPKPGGHCAESLGVHERKVQSNGRYPNLLLFEGG